MTDSRRHPFKDKVSQILDSAISMIAPLSTSDDAQIYKVTLDDGRICVVKTSRHSLTHEAQTLRTLQDLGNLPTPQIYHDEEHLLIEEYILSDWQINAEAQRDAAKHLARLHDVTHETYGYDYDTEIASVQQSNTPALSWTDFFINQRLLHMAELAYRHETIDEKLLGHIEKLAKKVPDIIGQGNAPSLIHGHCWGGNILPMRGKIKAFIDPAIHYADHEMDLAFMTVFNTADQNFFASYQQHKDIKPGFFEERCTLYTVYPLLVYSILFGRSYARKISKAVNYFL